MGNKKFARKENTVGGKQVNPILKNIFDNSGFQSLAASIISIFIGLILGYIVLVFIDAGKSSLAIYKIISKGFASPDKFAKVLYQAAPLIMTGLAVGFAFKTGLFNIGATGQYTVGAFFALFGALVWGLPWWVCLLLSLVGGAIWGAFPGIFKALLNVNEVITSIMFNWIGLFMVNLTITNTPQMLANYYGAPNADRTASLFQANTDAIIPKFGLDNLFHSGYMNIGIFIAIIISIVIYTILNKTTFGYELKACGFNRNASKYAGISAKRNIILSMVISGALAGIGGGLYYLSGVGDYILVKNLLAMGFNGIPVALLGSSNPLAIIFSGLFISYIQVGGEALQPDFTVEIINVIIAVIIYMSAFALILKNMISKILNKKQNKADTIDMDSGIIPPPEETADVNNVGDSGAGILPGNVRQEEDKK